MTDPRASEETRSAVDDTPPTGPRDDRPTPGRPSLELSDLISAMEVRSTTFRQLAERSERHLARLIDAFPMGVAVVRGDHILAANATARAHLAVADPSTLDSAAVARLADGGFTFVPGLDGAPRRVSAHGMVWDDHDCLLLVVDAPPVPAAPAAGVGAAAAASAPPAQDDTGAAPPRPVPVAGEPAPPAPHPSPVAPSSSPVAAPPPVVAVPAAAPVPRRPSEGRLPVVMPPVTTWEPPDTTSPPPPAPPPAPAVPAGTAAPPWRPVVDLTTSSVAGFVLETLADGDEEPNRLFQRAVVRAGGALSGWARSADAATPPFAMLPVPPGAAMDAGTVAFVEAVMRRAEVAPGGLWLAVGAPSLTGAAGDAVRALRRSGTRIALEGFARGGTEIDTLRAFEVDGVVLDEALLGHGEWGVVQTALSVARHLGLATMAVGVGDEATHHRLVALGCRWAGGRLYGEPVDPVRAARMAGRPALPPA